MADVVARDLRIPAAGSGGSRCGNSRAEVDDRVLYVPAADPGRRLPGDLSGVLLDPAWRP